MSAAETILAVQLEQAGIPFEREYRFAPPRRWRADVWVWSPELDRAYEARKEAGFTTPPEPWESDPGILVEIDGGGYVGGRHSRGLGMEHDCEKASAAAIRGYRVIRCTPSQVDDGRALAWIQEALGLPLTIRRAAS